MKKFLTLLLVICMVVCLVACGEETNESSETPATSAQTSGEASSKEEETSKASSEEPAASSEEPAASSEEPAESSEEPVSEPEESSEDGGLTVADYITQYIHWGTTVEQGIVSIRNTDPTSIRLTAVNTGAVDNVAGVLAFNADYGKTIKSDDGKYDDYAVYVFEYDPDTFHYLMTKSYKLDDKDKDSVKIPVDGFVLAIHSHFDKYITAINGANKEAAFYPHGFRGTNDVDGDIKNKTVTVDGNVTEKEYGTLVWDIEPDSGICSYGQFEKDNYYSTAKAYLAYDKDNLYLGVVVTSPYHNCAVTQANASSMYNYECIQVNVTNTSPLSDYIFENWDNVVNNKAVADGVVRQYGFAVNDNDETIYCVWMPGGGVFTGNTVCVRDDEKQTTTYEVSIPWSEIGDIDVKKGTEIGVSVSINSGNNTFKNIMLRDGGGIIGLNDWSKVPTITLG